MMLHKAGIKLAKISIALCQKESVRKKVLCFLHPFQLLLLLTDRLALQQSKYVRAYF